MNILDVIGGILVTLLLLPTLVSLWVFGYNQVEMRQVASQMVTVNQAAASYCAARKVQTNIALVLSAFPLNGLFLSYAACLKPLKYTSSGVW